jgi:uncharacterized protein (TIRG00374 family)
LSKHIRIAAACGVTLVFLWLSIRNVNLDQLGTALRDANYVFLLPAAACSALAYLLRAARWHVTLSPVKEIPTRRLFPVTMIGFAANNVLPARIGEVVRAYVLGSREGISRSTALGTVLAERVFDGLTLIVLMIVAFLVYPLPGDDRRLQFVAVSAVVIFGLAGIGIVLLVLWPGPMMRLVRLVTRVLPGRLRERALGLLETFFEGLSTVRSASMLARIALLSLGVWLLEGGAFAAVLRAFSLGLDSREWLAAALFLLIFVNLGIMVPSAPGYIGTYQFFATLALGAFHVSASNALGLAIIAHATQYVLICSLGLISLFQLGLTPFSLRRLVPSVAPAPAVGSGGPGGSRRSSV